MNANLSRKHTLLGMGALFMWAVEPLLISEVESLPIFELLTIIFFSSFLLTALRLTLNKRWSQVRGHSPLIWITGLVGVCGSDFAYIHGAQYAPIAHVDLIDYLWPCVAVIFTGFLPKERFSLQHITGAFLGLSGIYILIAADGALKDISREYATGYLLALVGAIVWGCYSVFSRHQKKLPTEMVGLYAGLGALVSFLLHLKLETFVMPTAQEGFLAILTGLTGVGLAYQLWDTGVKFGDIYLLSILTYAARLIGMMLLVAFGKEPLTWNLVFACSVTTLGIMITKINLKRLFGKLLKVPKRYPLETDELLGDTAI